MPSLKPEQQYELTQLLGKKLQEYGMSGNFMLIYHSDIERASFSMMTTLPPGATVQILEGCSKNIEGKKPNRKMVVKLDDDEPSALN